MWRFRVFVLAQLPPQAKSGASPNLFKMSLGTFCPEFAIRLGFITGFDRLSRALLTRAEQVATDCRCRCRCCCCCCRCCCCCFCCCCCCCFWAGTKKIDFTAFNCYQTICYFWATLSGCWCTSQVLRFTSESFVPLNDSALPTFTASNWIRGVNSVTFVLSDLANFDLKFRSLWELLVHLSPKVSFQNFATKRSFDCQNLQEKWFGTVWN